MNRLWVFAQLLAASAAVAAQPSLAETSPSLPPDNIRARQDVCYALATGVAPLDLADCFSLANAPEPAFRIELCSFLNATGQLEDFQFASRAQCLRDGFQR